MCGLFAYVGPDLPEVGLLGQIANAGRRGPHAHGWFCDGEITHELGPMLPARAPIGRTVIGHARLATFGNPRDLRGIQPIVADGHVIAHNGNIVHHDRLWPVPLPSDTWALASRYADLRDRRLDPIEILDWCLAVTDRPIHALIVLDRNGTLLASHHGLPLWQLHHQGGVYLSSVPFADATQLEENTVHELRSPAWRS